MAGAEFRISGPEALADEGTPTAAWNGNDNEYLVVWSDPRDPVNRGDDIYGRRVAEDGALIDGDIRISGPEAVANEVDPAIAWNTTEYLVVWSDDRKAGLRGTDIYGQRLSAAGEPVGDAFRISGAGALDYEAKPAVAWTGSEFLVVWEDGRNSAERNTDIYGRRVSAAGEPQGSDIRISGTNAVADEVSPTLAWTGGEFLVVWSDSRNEVDRGWDIRGRRVSVAGAPDGKDFRISGTSATADDSVPAVSWSGAGYLVVWQDWRLLPDRQTDIYGRLVSVAGKPTGANFRVCGPEATGWDWVPAVSWGGMLVDQYLVVWQDERNWGYARRRHLRPAGGHHRGAGRGRFSHQRSRRRHLRVRPGAGLERNGAPRRLAGLPEHGHPGPRHLRAPGGALSSRAAAVARRCRRWQTDRHDG